MAARPSRASRPGRRSTAGSRSASPARGGAPGGGAHPGGGFLDVDEDLSAPPGEGRHPLPAAEDFAAAAATAGIGADSFVVAYDESGEGGAARLWWLLRHFGHENVAVLDGGLRGWRGGGGHIDDLPPRPWPSGDPFVPRERRGDVADADELGVRLRDSSLALVDARAAERFRGEVEPVDPVAGHIPGARSVPSSVVAPSGRFRPAADYGRRLAPSEGPGTGGLLRIGDHGVNAGAGRRAGRARGAALSRLVERVVRPRAACRPPRLSRSVLPQRDHSNRCHDSVHDSPRGCGAVSGWDRRRRRRRPSRQPHPHPHRRPRWAARPRVSASRHRRRTRVRVRPSSTPCAASSVRELDRLAEGDDGSASFRRIAS